MITFKNPETPPPTVPPGYIVLTDREHFDLTQQAAKAEAEDMFDDILTPGHSKDYEEIRHKLFLVFEEIEKDGEGLAEVRRLRAEAERTARDRRHVGRLSTRSEIRRELGELYRETYAASPEDGRHFTRMAYMLDCLARLAQKDPKPRLKRTETAGQSTEE